MQIPNFMWQNMDNIPQNWGSSIITATSKRTFYNDYPHVCV